MLDNTNKVIGSFDVCSMSECPEDALLSRGLGFVYKIPTLLQKAWQAGGDEGSGTRSSLMYETLRIVEKLKPKCVIWENVKNLLSKKHRPNFDAYQEKMKELGYTNYYQVLNAKDYGIPQNRERVFTVSILNGRCDYEFPQPILL